VESKSRTEAARNLSRTLHDLTVVTRTAQRSIEKARSAGATIIADIRIRYGILQATLRRVLNTNDVYEYLEARDELLLSLGNSLEIRCIIRESNSQVSEALALVDEYPEIGGPRWVPYRIAIEAYAWLNQRGYPTSELYAIWSVLSQHEKGLFLEDMECARKCVVALKDVKLALENYENRIRMLRDMTYAASSRNTKMASVVELNKSIDYVDYYLNSLLNINRGI